MSGHTAAETLYRRRELGDGHVSYEPIHLHANSHAELVKALEEMIEEFAVDDARCDCRVCSITNRARAALATLTARKVG